MRVCPRCQHVNPDEAAFCHFDGMDLRAVPVRAAGDDVPLALPVEPSHLPFEFVFPTGRHCRTFDELAAGCMEDWNAAREMLQQGALRQYLTGCGRLDLARVADEVQQQHADIDLALDAFLQRLPATHLPKPQLVLAPQRLVLGMMPTGQTRQVEFAVLNQGAGLLHGSLSVVGSGWLRIQGIADKEALPLKVFRQQAVVLEVDTRGIRAPQSCSGRLTLVTNAGIVEVPVRLEVGAQPFEKPPYEGVSSPRDLAVKIRANPKLAVPLFESGDIARWFEVNAWGYPIVGPAAPKLGAVQQFFEGLGLAKPPHVELAENVAEFTCSPGETCSGQASLVTRDRKWVYARATADVPWLKVAPATVGGPQKASIDFDVDSRGLAANVVHEGNVLIVANSGQKLTLRVRFEVIKPEQPVSRRWARPILTAALLALTFRVLVAAGAEMAAHWLGARPTASETVKWFVLGTWWIGAVGGIVWMGRRGSRWADLPCGLVAGAATGIAVSATMACLLPVLDAPAHWLQTALPHRLSFSGFADTAAKIVLAAVTWFCLGGLAGVFWSALWPSETSVIAENRVLPLSPREAGVSRTVRQKPLTLP